VTKTGQHNPASPHRKLTSPTEAQQRYPREVERGRETPTDPYITGQRPAQSNKRDPERSNQENSERLREETDPNTPTEPRDPREEETNRTQQRPGSPRDSNRAKKG
jgi:hypothetical protein